jgi:hypothetical protein
MGPLLTFVGSMIVVAIVVHIALAGLMGWFHSRESPTAALPLLEPPPERQGAPGPVLQANPPADLGKYLADEDAALDALGWVDRKSGIASIPIGVAMDLVARKGLPAWKPDAKAEDGTGSKDGSKSESKEMTKPGDSESRSEAGSKSGETK